MLKNDMLDAVAEQLSLDLACSPADFEKSQNTVTFSKIMFGRRNFQDEKDFFHIATFGDGAVASVDAKIFSFTENILSKIEGIKLFDAQSVYVINQELEKYGKIISSFNQYYLPKTPYYFPENSGYKLELFEGESISALYKYPEFQNALLYKNSGIRRDVIAICARNGDQIIGIAGASNDSDRMWQIGIDVNPSFRRKGLARILVSAITNEILMRGAVPYYGTWWSNIASMNVALTCGYYPAWSEMSAINIK
ncbi:MAG: GNAT family N-acetyltransferase [Oscillospiraceae bacterium]